MVIIQVQFILYTNKLLIYTNFALFGWIIMLKIESEIKIKFYISIVTKL